MPSFAMPLSSAPRRPAHDGARRCGRRTGACFHDTNRRRWARLLATPSFMRQNALFVVPVTRGRSTRGPAVTDPFDPTAGSRDAVPRRRTFSARTTRAEVRRPTRIRPVARHGRQHATRRWLVVMRWLGLAAAILGISAVTVAAYATWSISSRIQTVELADASTGADAGTAADADGPIRGSVNLLLVGSDTREGQSPDFGDTQGSLGDATMLVHISADRTNATVVSFPRDLVVPVPACPSPSGGTFDPLDAQPLNMTLSYGGLPCTVLTVEQLTGLDIPYAAEVRFDGVVEMSNALGGVPVCVAQPIDDDLTGIHLGAGLHELQGMDALQFLRTRSGVGDGSEAGRISSQQVFLASLMRTIKSDAALGDVGTMYALASAASQNMVLSTSLASPERLASVGTALREVDLGSVVFAGYPGVPSDEGDFAGMPRPDYADAAVLIGAIGADQRVAVLAVGVAAAPDTSGVVPTPSPSGSSASDSGEPDSGDPSTATGGPSASGSGSAAAGAVTVLPPTITGQPAAAPTCTVGNGGR
ncbi:LytR family transcriptional regulator [Humibacter sp. BT305]|nr:LytR family transcriptional regulator [Humibacter sp. BT305]